MGSIRDYVDLGIVHFMAYPRALSDDRYMVDTLKELIEMDHFDFVEIKGTDDSVLLDEMRSYISDSKTSVKYCAHTRIFGQQLNPNAMTESDRQDAVDGVCRAIDEALYLGATDIGMPSGPNVKRGDKTQALQQLEKSLIEICRYAVDRGANIFLEPFDIDIDKNRLVGHAPIAAQVASAVSAECQNFHLMVDLSHIPLLSENIEECVTTLGPHIGHAHVGNCFMSDTSNPAYGDRHPPYDYPGTEIGVDEIRRYLEALIDIGYINKKKRSSVAFEIMPVDPDKSKEAIANAIETLDQAWRFINY